MSRTIRNAHQGRDAARAGSLLPIAVANALTLLISPEKVPTLRVKRDPGALAA